MYKLLVFASKNSKYFLTAFFLFFVVYPFVFSSPFALRMGTLCLVFVMLAVSLNLVTGFMGQNSFGTAAFWGIGAYTSALLSTKLGMESQYTFLLAVLISGVFALLLGMPALKLRGYYLAIVSLGFCEIVRLVELNWMSLTRGPLGIVNIPKMIFFGVSISDGRVKYLIMLLLVLLTVAIMTRISRSHVGRIMTSIRDDEIAAQAMGVNLFKYKVIAFVIYGMLCGLCGAFYAHFVNYIDPTMFTVNQSIEITVMAILGGLGNIFGVCVAAIVLTALPEIMRDLLEYRYLFYGLLMVVMMIVKPSGFLGNVNFRYIRQRAALAEEDAREEKA